MALFLSTYVNKIDKKGRVSIPALFRSALSSSTQFSGVIAYPSFVHSCIEACGFERIEKLSQSIDNLDPYSEERDAFATSILGGCIQLSMDGEGRVTLPESLIEISNLKDKATFVGKGQTFEIWDPESFRTYEANARKLAKERKAALTLQTQTTKS